MQLGKPLKNDGEQRLLSPTAFTFPTLVSGWDLRRAGSGGHGNHCGQSVRVHESPRVYSGEQSHGSQGNGEDRRISGIHVHVWYMFYLPPQILGMLLRSKGKMINSNILHLTYTLVGTVDSAHESACIPNPVAFSDLLAGNTRKS